MGVINAKQIIIHFSLYFSFMIVRRQSQLPQWLKFNQSASTSYNIHILIFCYESTYYLKFVYTEIQLIHPSIHPYTCEQAPTVCTQVWSALKLSCLIVIGQTHTITARAINTLPAKLRPATAAQTAPHIVYTHCKDSIHAL